MNWFPSFISGVEIKFSSKFGLLIKLKLWPLKNSLGWLLILMFVNSEGSFHLFLHLRCFFKYFGLQALLLNKEKLPRLKNLLTLNLLCEGLLESLLNTFGFLKETSISLLSLALLILSLFCLVHQGAYFSLISLFLE